MKVLIVDDDPIQLEMLVELLLSIEGIEPFPVSSTSLALKMVHRGEIYLVLTGHHMPVMNGVELIAKIREFNAFIECIIMTADDHKEIVIESLQSGAHDFIQKPFSPEQILEVVRKAIKRVNEIATIEELKNRQIAKAISLSKSDREAAERLGINYTTLARNKKHENKN